MVKKTALLFIASTFALSAHADYLGGFANTSINYLDWTSHTTHKSGNSSHKDDFAYLELEGGANFSWGEFYGFFDLENPFNRRKTEPGHNQRYTLKTTTRIYLAESGFNLYGHVYGTWSLPSKEYGGNFHEVNTLYGIGYNTFFQNLWFKPFVALHYVDQTFYSGNNGYVVGWVAGYDFNVKNQKFSITNWHEMEFDRDKNYGNGGRNGINGAIAFWWHATDSITTGVQYRYAHNKLGEDFLQDGVVYSLKYNF
ncbi:outer membrane protein OmpK [Proteus myxofaciens]|uniref:Putative exported protein n=1 Tax=Proteus myxofaciens ATCC 19692 TaxID=1354337 RepID=A0A198FLJ8_9GAMM|nr:outer membrane protein OmpK [Proteus myxofaciens]OAT25738.1 putative exported protein [Proteus myxofaciens ATCC 19692]